MLAEHWWFWAAVGALAVAIVATEPRWRSAAAAVRAAALGRRLVAAGAGLTVERGGEGRWSEPWLPAFFVGVWVCASPWIWGYDDVDGAIAADVVTGAAIAVVSLAGVVFPALLALNVLAGLWLTTAPWLVGFGTDVGPGRPQRHARGHRYQRARAARHDRRHQAPALGRARPRRPGAAPGSAALAAG